MNKKTIIILLTIGALVLVIGVVVFFTSRNGETTDESGGGFFSNLFPGGGERDIENGGLKGTEPSGQPEMKNFSQLTDFAVAGATAASTTIRYVEKSTGHIYEISPQGGDRKRLSNTTILKIFETLWSPDADKMIMRYLNDSTVSNFSAKFSTSTAAVDGTFFPQETVAITTSPFEDKVFYLQQIENTTYGFITDFTNKKKDNVFSSPFSGFNIAWPAKNIITLTTKPASGADGYLYFLDTKTKGFSKIIGKVKGMTVLVSPKTDKVLYSQSVNSGFITKIFDVKTKTSKNFSLSTLPEKCIWSKINSDIIFCAVPKSLPSASYPDEWYQGLVSFDDAIWQINVATGETQILYDETNADTISPFLTVDENYFVFTNKEDLTLWSLRLK